jgi:hypothetical protein
VARDDPLHNPGAVARTDRSNPRRMGHSPLWEMGSPRGHQDNTQVTRRTRDESRCARTDEIAHKGGERWHQTDLGALYESPRRGSAQRSGSHSSHHGKSRTCARYSSPNPGIPRDHLAVMGACVRRVAGWWGPGGVMQVTGLGRATPGISPVRHRQSAPDRSRAREARRQGCPQFPPHQLHRVTDALLSAHCGIPASQAATLT